MIRLWQIFLLLVIVVITIIHSNRFADNKSIGPWWHLLWSLIYAVPAGLLAWLYHSWWLLGAFTLERFVFYNPVLNALRDRPFFYIVQKNSKPGFWDKIETWMAGFYPYVWGLCFVGFIVIQFFI